MRSKKINVGGLIRHVNHLNTMSICSPEMRSGWNALLEDVLYRTGNYAGFTYLTQDDVPTGHEPGIAELDGKKIFPDETRKRYLSKDQDHDIP